MIALRVILALALLELIGLAVFHLVCTDPRRWRPVERIGIGFACGLVALPAWLMLASLAGQTPSVWLAALELVGLCAIVVLRRARHPQPSRPEPVERAPAPLSRAVEITSIGWIALSCAVVGAASVLEPIAEWDVIAIWALKARVLLAEPMSTSSYFHDPALAFSHVDYPVLWPFAIAWMWCAVGSFDLVAPKVLAPGILVAIAALLFGILRRLGDRTEAAIFTAVLLSLPMVLAVSSRLLADAPLALFVLGAFGCFRLWLDSHHADDSRLAGLFAAGMLLTKNDGLGLFSVLVIAAITVSTGSLGSRARDALRLLVLPLVLASPWLLFRSSLPRWNENYEGRLHELLAVPSLDRVLASLRAWLSGFGELSDWLIFWPVLAIVVSLGWRSLGERGSIFLMVALVLSFGLYVGITIISPWELAALMESAQHRLLVHLSVLAVLLLAEVSRSARLMPWAGWTDE